MFIEVKGEKHLPFNNRGRKNFFSMPPSYRELVTSPINTKPFYTFIL